MHMYVYLTFLYLQLLCVRNLTLQFPRRIKLNVLFLVEARGTTLLSSKTHSSHAYVRTMMQMNFVLTKLEPNFFSILFNCWKEEILDSPTCLLLYMCNCVYP